MKKAVIFAAALLVGVQMLGDPLTAQAASGNVVVKKIVVNRSDLTDCFGKLEKLDISLLGNCTVIKIPCFPGMGSGDAETETPSAPETETPNIPETETPSAPEAETPNIPETETPSAPETETPSTPEVETPGTPETETPEAPEVETPDESSYHAYVLRVAELVNEEREKAGLQPLTLKADVTEAAQVRAVEIVKSFSHTRPDGRKFSTALTEAGVSYRGAGENIAWGQKTPEQVMEAWMNSEGHRANILNEKYTSIGVGYYSNANGVNYWSQLFTY